MSKRMPRHARRDSNESEIVRHLRAIGAQVYRLSAPGMPDLLVNFHGQTYFMEDKTRKGKLTGLQVATFSDWAGSEIYVVRSVDEALTVLGAAVTA